MVFSKGILKAIIMLDDEEEEAFVLRMLLTKAACRKRRVKWRHKRIGWNKHVEMLRHVHGFQGRYHMTEPSFNKLVALLHPQLVCDELQSI